MSSLTKEQRTALGVTAALCGAAGVGYVAYTQISKRLPKWRRQQALLQEVNAPDVEASDGMTNGAPTAAPINAF